MAILTTDRQLIVLDEDLQIRSQFPAKTWTGEIAMHPDGKWIIGNSDAGAVKWSLEVPGQAAEVLPAPKYNQMMHCVSGTRYDYWLDSSNYNAYDGQRFSTTTNQAYLFDFALVDTFVCDLDNGSWIFASAWRLTPDGTPQFVLQDLAIPGMVSSIPIAITPPPLKMAINADATTIAMATATSIDVIQRARWYDPAGNTPVRYAANLLRDGRLDQVEATARFLRSIPRYMYNQSGERIYSIMAAELADVWVSAETYDDQAMLERCQDWYHQGSELAITASAIRHHRIAWQSRGGGYADTVTQAGWADFERRMSLAIRDLQRLLDRDRPPESAFAFMIDCMRDSGMDREQVESLLQRYVELYPYEIDAHARLCFSLLQKWGGDEGEIGAYVTALAGVYPAEYAETLYARCALQLAAYANNSWEFAYGELSVRRIATEARKWMSNGTLTHNQAIHLLGIATHNRDEGFAREVAEYTVRHFNLRSHQLYHFDVPTYLDDARARSIETLRTTIDIE